MRVKSPGKRLYERAFEAYGVPLIVEASDSNLLARLAAELPPGAKPCRLDAASARFGLGTDEELGYLISSEGEVDIPCRDLELAVSTVQMEIRQHVARHAPEHVFIHAGVVAHRGRALMLPGQSFAGKTTLVAALVRAGATYYSDEFAVLDEAGEVHPYPHSLTIRDANGTAVTRPIESLGGTTGERPVPVGVVAISTYESGADWNPVSLSAAQGVLAVIGHAVAVHDRPAETLAVVHRALSTARVLEGVRGEADEAATAMLAGHFSG
jgi:hypothetical protein